MPLPGAAVDDRLGAELERERRDRLGDHGPGQRRHERVLALVERVRLDRLRDLLASRTRSCGRAGARRPPRPPRPGRSTRRRRTSGRRRPGPRRPRRSRSPRGARRSQQHVSRPPGVREHCGPGHATQLLPSGTRAARRAGRAPPVVPSARDDEDRVLAGDRAGDVWVTRLVDHLGEGVREAVRRLRRRRGCRSTRTRAPSGAAPREAQSRGRRRALCPATA